MTGMTHLTDPKEFEKFHKLLTQDQPGYTPWYFLLSKGLKDPVAGISWKQLEGRLTFEQAIAKMRTGHNIGIAATGMDALCIVDVDDIEATPDDIVKPTLSTRSRKRIGRHYFFFTDDPRCKENLPTEGKGEIRSSFEYVVAPGSFVLCDSKTMAAMPESQRELAGRYTVENERAPNTITFEELPPVFLEQAEKNRKIEREAKKKREAKAKARKDKKTAHGSDKNKSAMWDLSIDDIMSIPNKTRFKSLFHDSTTGKNTALNDDGGLTCWRHLVTHTPLSALCVLAGVADCNSAGQGFNRGKSSCIDYSDGMTLFKMWSFAKQEGMIPKNDPIPSGALGWYAVDKGICAEKDMFDGWKLSGRAYAQAIDRLESDGLPAGRKRVSQTSPEKTATLDALGAALEKKLDTFDIVEALQKENPIIYDSGKQFWMWSEESRKYMHIDEIDVLNVLKNVMHVRGGTISPARTAYLQAIKMTGRELVVRPPKLSWIAFNDCVVDIETGDQFVQKSDWFFTNTIPFKYGDSEETPTIDQLFVSWVGEDHKQMLYEIAAYCLYNHYPIHRAFLLCGSGRNGKGQYINMLEKWLGPENVTSSSLELLISSRFESTKLYQKKACFMGETDYSAMNKTNTFKMLTGDDSFGGEFKGGKHFDFHNYAKLIIATNSVPPSDDKTDGFGSRWAIIDFPNRFEIGSPVINSIPDWEYENLCRKSVTILRALLERGLFVDEGDTAARAKRYEEKSNPIQKFITLNCDVHEGLSMPLWEFYEGYDGYQEANHLRSLKKPAVSKWLRSNGFDLEKDHTRSSSWVMIYGMELKAVTPVTLVTPNPTSYSPGEKLSESKGHKGHKGHNTQSDQMKSIDIFFREHKDVDNKTTPIDYASREQLVEYVPDIAEHLHIGKDAAFRLVMQYGKDRGWI